MIIYTFIGTWKYYLANVNEGVKVIYNPSNRAMSAETSAGGIPQVSYKSYNPDSEAGTLISELIEGDERVRIFFKKEYPFAYVEVSTIVPDPEVLIIDSIAATPQSEQGLNDGVAIISVSQGTPPYQYSLDGVNYQSSNSFTGLTPGNYTAFAKTAIDPVTTKEFNIAIAPLIQPPIEPIVKDVIVEQGGEISIQNAYKRVEVSSEFGKVPSLLYNGDFETWDGQNFNFWTRYGGLNFSRVQREVTNANGVKVPIENWALRFNAKADSGKYLESSPIPFQKGDTAKFQYRVSKTLDVSEWSHTEERKTALNTIKIVHNLKTFYSAKIRFKIGNYYLYNLDFSSSYTWGNSLSFVGNPIYNKDGDINTYSYNFQMPECPVSGNMVIQLYGFEKILMDSIVSVNGQTTDGTGTTYTPLEEYSAITIDDVSLSKSSQSENNDVVGLLSVSESLGYYTEKPDQIKILFGDYFNSSAGSDALSNLYAIQIGNRNSTGWYEYGTSTGSIAFGLALAKSILRAYQKPFRFWLGQFKLRPLAEEISYLNTFSFDVPGQTKFSNKVFAILGCNIDLKYNTVENLKLAEIFDKPGKSTDITVPSYPGSTPPVFVQDPNGNTNNSGIFTDEFTIEFS